MIKFFRYLIVGVVTYAASRGAFKMIKEANKELEEEYKKKREYKK